MSPVDPMKVHGPEMETLEEEEDGLEDIDVDKKVLQRRTYKNLIAVSAGFLFTFTAFQALQNLQSSIHSDADLGLGSLVSIYAALVISCMFVPPLLIGKIGAKYTIMLAMCGYVLYTVSMFYPRYGTLIPASLILGICAAPLWASKCAYVTTMGIRYGKGMNISEDVVITKLFGLFFLIFQSGQIWGNLISSQILKPSGAKSNSTEDVGLICGANYCPSTVILSQNQQTDPETVKILMGIYLAFGCLAILTIFLFLDPIKIVGDNNKKGNCHLFIATLRFLKERKMQLLIPITLFSGLEQGFVFADFTAAYITCALGIEKVGLIMICFGAVDAFFSLFLGKIVEWTGRPIMIITGAIVNFAILILFLKWEPRESSMYVFYVGAALWGFSDAVWQTQINAFYGVIFPKDQEVAFSNYRLWESLGFVISFAYAKSLCVDVKLYILIVVLIIGVGLYGVIEFLRRRDSEEYNINEVDEVIKP